MMLLVIVGELPDTVMPLLKLPETFILLICVLTLVKKVSAELADPNLEILRLLSTALLFVLKITEPPKFALVLPELLTLVKVTGDDSEPKARKLPVTEIPAEVVLKSSSTPGSTVNTIFDGMLKPLWNW